MRVSALGLAPLVLVSFIACGARTDLTEVAPGAPAADGGLLGRDSGGPATEPGPGPGPVPGPGVEEPAPPPLNDAGPGVTDPGVPGVRDAGPSRDAGVPVRDAGPPVRDAGGGGLQACTQCAAQQCPQQSSACFASPACIQSLSCATGCLANGFGAQTFTCLQACNIPPAQQQVILGLLQCIGQRCRTQCAALGGAGGPGGG